MKNLQRTVLVLLALFLCLAQTAFASGVVNLSDSERRAMNLFLSNFTEVGRDIAFYSGDAALVDFAHDHLWFNDYDSFEYGEYFNDNNCRVADNRIQEIIDRYFDGAFQVDLSQSRFDYDGEYYYHIETGGGANGGFALTLNAYAADDNRYYVSFLTFGAGDNWSGDDLKLNFADAEMKFGVPAHGGHAWITASDLSDRSTYRMVSFSY